MRLRQVKISGFKSFADPTVIEFPSGFVGIVGPNGCGKSNVIDAVRWVMGEGRAGELRATSSMLELIFSGSEGRAPAGRASVEMVLDNSDGSLTGPWGAYSDVSVKRILTRDGGSAYFINNQPVRRRDILDIFLGTGLGPHSYAIISQGMVSSFVRAKPEELRVYFEEAAGVSRYRERRREAESRLNATRENLSRAGDIQVVRREEIDKLGVEAELASRWKALNEKKEKLVAVWLALQEEEARNSRDKIASNIAGVMAEVEAGRTERTALDRQITEVTLELGEARRDEEAKRDELNKLNLALTRAQSAISSIVEKKKLLSERITRDEEKLARVRAEQKAAAEREEKFRSDAEDLTEEAEGLSEESENASAVLDEAKKRLEKAREKAKAASAEETEAQRSLTEINFRESALTRERNALEERSGKLENEKAQVSQSVRGELSAARETLEECVCALDEYSALEEEAAEALERADSARLEAVDGKTRASGVLSDVRGRLAALSDVRQKLSSGEKLPGWLASRGLSGLPSVLKDVEIEPGWERAVEAALSGRIRALKEDEPARFASLESNPPPVCLTFASASGSVPEISGTLAEKVSSPDPKSEKILMRWLSFWKTAETLEKAAELAKSHPGERFVTKQGHAASDGEISFWAEENPASGSLFREAEIRALETQKQQAEREYEASLERVVKTESAREEAHRAASAAAASLEKAKRDHHQAELRFSSLQSTCAADEKRSGQIAEDLQAVKERLAEIEVEIEEAEASFEEADIRLSNASQAAQDAEMSAEAARNEVDAAESRSRDAASRILMLRSDAAHALDRARDAAQTVLKCDADEAEILASLEESRALLEELDEDAARNGFEENLKSHEASEKALEEASKVTAEISEKIAGLSQRRETVFEAERPKLERVGEMKVKQGSIENELSALTSQIEERGVDRETVLAEAKEAGWKTAGVRISIGKIDAEITGLGPVNHAALEHLEAAKKALEETESQIEDLNSAIATLEEAIRKIDAETRAVLRDTFRKVNANFEELFSQIFGGGQASLEMTGDEILEAGIEIRAQPPGKRNASVKLLSGGEQALTATALVFALFRLNPAPFCLLDEVDAPLDEANQIRLANLVNAMSSATQFIAITHHRITMESARQLIGVTMKEPGVSRVVSVDIEEAVSYAGRGR